MNLLALKETPKQTGCQIFVIANYENQDGEIMMAFLPSYSPELNLDEQVWNRAKAEVGKYPIQSKGLFGKNHSFSYGSNPTKNRSGKKFFQITSHSIR